VLTKQAYRSLLDSVKVGEWRRSPGGVVVRVIEIDQEAGVAKCLAPREALGPASIRLLTLATWKVLAKPPSDLLRWQPCRAATTTGLPCTHQAIEGGLCKLHLRKARAKEGSA
jgi:hypothetical protein